MEDERKALSGAGLRALNIGILMLEFPKEILERFPEYGSKLAIHWYSLLESIRYAIAEELEENESVSKDGFLSLLADPIKVTCEKEILESIHDMITVNNIMFEAFFEVFDNVHSEYFKNYGMDKSSVGQHYTDPSYASGLYLKRFLYRIEGNRKKALHQFAKHIIDDGKEQVSQSDIEGYFTSLKHGDARDALIKEAMVWFRDSLVTENISVKESFFKDFIALVSNGNSFAEYFLDIALIQGAEAKDMSAITKDVWRLIEDVTSSFLGKEEIDVRILADLILQKAATFSINGKAVNYCISYMQTKFVEFIQSPEKKEKYPTEFIYTAHRVHGISLREDDLGISY